MNDLRNKLEIMKFKEEEKTISDMKENKDYNLDLFRYRHELKAVILQFNSELPKREKEIFRKQYNQCLVTRRIKYPCFIFDEFNQDNFEKCLLLRKKGYTLPEIEDEYLKLREEENEYGSYVKIR